MLKCNWPKWILPWAILPLGLGAAALLFNSDSLEDKLGEAAGSQLKSAGQEWAAVMMDGRDAKITGEAPDQDAITKAAEMVAGTYGVRRADVSGATVAPPIVLDAPTVGKVEAEGEVGEITGTWPEGKATTLAVGVAGTTYMLGKDNALTSDGSGNWKLMMPEPLKEGSYDVDVKITDGKKAEATAASAAAIVVKAPPPPPPAAEPPAQAVVSSVSGDNPPVITGTWPEREGNSLAVALGEKSYVLGSDNELQSDGSGNWTLSPSAPLTDGSYDVKATVTGKDNLTSDAMSAAPIKIATVAPEAPQVVSASRGNPPQVSGTWPEQDGNALAVTLADKTYNLGSDGDLTSDGSGSWVLKPADKLADGVYDVTATVTGKTGLSSSSTGTGMVSISTPAPGAPTVSRVSGFSNTPNARGTWPERNGNKLSVALASRVYQLGTDKELVSDGSGNWSLTPSSPLADGKYDVVASVTNSVGKVTDARGEAVIVVDATPPAAPTVNKVESRSVRPSVTGTWPESDAKMLVVEVNKQAYELGKDAGLTSDGSGNWTLKLDQDLPDNTYDVVATATDEAGNSSTDRDFGEVVVDASAPAVPTVNNLLTRLRQPVVTGAWPSKDAEKLTVAVGAKTYVAGAGDGLTTDNENWTLRIGESLADGTYNVSATATDRFGNSATDASDGELVVDATPPAVPTVNSYKAEHPRPLLSGKFPEDEGVTLAVTFDGETFAKGSSGELATDGKGNWSILTRKDYAPGKYDVKVVVADKAGNQRSDTSVDEVEIVAPPKPVQPAGPDCQALLNEATAGQEVFFATARAKILSQSDELMAKVAEVIKQCPDAKIEIGGHTDATGSTSYNQALSERRANSVRDALVALGANAANISAIGYGESQPIADNATKDGRAENRRTEFKVIE